MTRRPLIGLTTYRKQVSDLPHLAIDGLMPTYTSAILKAGGLPVLIPLTLEEADLEALFDRLDGILLPGGGDIAPALYGGEENSKIYGIDEGRDRIELWLARRAIETDRPLLGVCRGHQVLNVALGGTLWEDVLDLMPGAIMHAYFRGYARDMLTHSVELCQGSHLARLMGQHEAKPVNSLHHQGIKVLAPPAGRHRLRPGRPDRGGRSARPPLRGRGSMASGGICRAGCGNAGDFPRAGRSQYLIHRPRSIALRPSRLAASGPLRGGSSLDIHPVDSIRANAIVSFSLRNPR